MKRIVTLVLALCMVVTLCGCNFENTQTKGKEQSKTAQSDKGSSSSLKAEEKGKESTNEKDLSTLPDTINTYAKNYSEVGEILPTKSLVSNAAAKAEITVGSEEDMSVYKSGLGYSIEYPKAYAPKYNFDGKEFIIIDEKSGSNMNVIVSHPNILYESEETYRKAVEGNKEMLLKKFEFAEVNGINTVQIQLAINGGYVHQTIYRTGQYYYILSYVQGRGVTLDFDRDMKAILNSLKLQ
ncbi:MAG: hypothetical protein PHE51_01420 [Eubacteriales bacterium]|nr:hypothetical protein [Eubacteriales bacterium]